MTSQLRLALLGYGFIGRMHEQAALACDLSITRVCRSSDDWRAAVRADDVDAVVIGTPNALHHPQAMAALRAGKHVLIDKPMAVTVAEGEEIAAEATAAGLTVLVGHMWRYRDEVIAARDRIAAGSVGRPVRTRGFGIHAGWGPSGWFTNPDLAGGGALIDMGIHAIDTARFLLGDPSPVRVTASIGTAYGDYPVDDDGVVLIEWSNGVRSVVESGWWQPRLDGVEAETEVYGTGGFERIWPQFTHATPPPDDYVHCSLPMFAAQMADFAHCCATGATPVASAETGLTALRVVESAYRDAEATRR
ncbi:MAG: Gfo/Idh/MocA family oxidoreductase [Acidimicrobiia bacterium]|nr:Gfo/Idh/MocA family oxidoreductase [Acidimicrobiia bacterium]